MSDFQNALKGFQEDNLSLDDLINVTEQMIIRDGVHPSIILTEFSEAHSKNPFPSNIKLRIQLAVALDENNDTNANLYDTIHDNHTIIESDTEDESADHPDSAKPTSRHEGPANKTNNTKPVTNRQITSILRRKPDNNLVVPQGLVLNGRYELVQHIGTGGMGSVYKAIDRGKLKAGFSNPHVAIKILHARFSTHQNQFYNIQQQAQRCQKLSHPNIVEVYECNRDGPIAYLVMEYLRGETLKDKIRSPGFDGFSKEKALTIIAAMGKALSFAHAEGIVHYDFKPSNVFVTDDDQIKIIDFGIARAIDHEDDADHSSSYHSAVTPFYASVEMLERLPPDPRDDIFSLAVTSYVILTGKHPFLRKRATEARYSGILPEKPKELSQAHWEAFKKAFAFERSHRTTEVSQFLTGIAAIKESRNRFFTLKNGIAASIIMIAASIIMIVVGVSVYLNSEKKALDNHSDSPIFPIQSRLNHDAQEFSEFAKLDVNHSELSAQPLHNDDPVEEHQRMQMDKQTVIDQQTKTDDIAYLSPSSLFKGASAGDTESVIAALASNISSNSLIHSSGQTALILAAQAGHTEVIQVLLEAQADLNHQDHQGRTALMWGVDQGRSEVVKFLLDRGADKNLRDAAGETALMRAVWKGHDHIVYFLMDKDTDVNSRYPDGLTLLSAAAINGYTHIAKALLDAGAAPNLTSNLGQTPLMAAAWNGHIDMVQLLAARGSSLDKVSNDGWTALMNAAWGGHANIVRRLVMTGANPSIRGRNRATAAQVANSQGHIEIADFLENKINKKPTIHHQDRSALNTSAPYPW
jgi:serine/threonine protein kinase